MLTFALPTGRSLDSCVDILERAGLPTEKLKNAGRNLVIEEASFRYLLSKPSDVPAMVHYGAADLALAGNDVIEEAGIALTELLDTGRGRCVMAVAGPGEMAEKFCGHVSGLMGLKVATKYTRLAEKTFAEWGIQIKLLKLNGSVELAPALGLADCIFDVVQTGCVFLCRDEQTWFRQLFEGVVDVLNVFAFELMVVAVGQRSQVRGVGL